MGLINIFNNIRNLINFINTDKMAEAVELKKKRTFRKYSYRGVDLDALLDKSTDELTQMFCARARRRYNRGLKRKPLALLKKLRKAKKRGPTSRKTSRC